MLVLVLVLVVVFVLPFVENPPKRYAHADQAVRKCGVRELIVVC